MGVAKGFLDQAADFLIFVIACTFAIIGFANIASIQNSLNNTLMDKGASMIADAYPDVRVSGEEVIALLLLPDGVQSVEIDGVVFISEIEDGMDYIYADRFYTISRESVAEGVRLVITTFVS